MRILLAALFFMITATATIAHAKTNWDKYPQSVYKATITKVTDGDTFKADVELGFNLTIHLTFRVLELDTPETFRPKSVAEFIHGKQAAVRAKELLFGKTLMIYSRKKGKYGRWLAKIILEDGSDYATTMVNEGFEKKDSYK